MMVMRVRARDERNRGVRVGDLQRFHMCCTRKCTKYLDERRILVPYIYVKKCINIIFTRITLPAARVDCVYVCVCV